MTDAALTQPTSWQPYGLRQIWSMLESESSQISGQQVRAWLRMKSVCEHQADLLRGGIERLATVWPAEASDASRVYQGAVLDLVQALENDAAAAHANARALETLVTGIAKTRGRVSELVDRLRTYEAEAANQSGWASDDHLRQQRAQLDEQARRAMKDADAASAAAAADFRIPKRYPGIRGTTFVHGPSAHEGAGPRSSERDREGSGEQNREGDAGQSMIPPPVLARPDPFIAERGWTPAPAVEVPTSLAGDVPPSRRQVSEPADLQSGLRPAEAADRRGGLGPTAGIDSTDGPPAYGPTAGPAAYRPVTRPVAPPGTAARPTASGSTGGAIMPGLAAPSRSAGAAARPGINRSRRARGARPFDPHDPWSVAEGLPPVIEPPTEPIVHDPGPNVIGLDR